MLLTDLGRRFCFAVDGEAGIEASVKSLFGVAKGEIGLGYVEVSKYDFRNLSADESRSLIAFLDRIFPGGCECLFRWRRLGDFSF